MNTAQISGAACARMLEEDRRAHATAAAVAWLQGTLDDISSFLFEDRDSQKPSRNSAQLFYSLRMPVDKSRTKYGRSTLLHMS